MPGTEGLFLGKGIHRTVNCAHYPQTYRLKWDPDGGEGGLHLASLICEYFPASCMVTSYHVIFTEGLVAGTWRTQGLPTESFAQCVQKPAYLRSTQERNYTGGQTPGKSCSKDQGSKKAKLPFRSFRRMKGLPAGLWSCGDQSLETILLLLTWEFSFLVRGFRTKTDVIWGAMQKLCASLP